MFNVNNATNVVIRNNEIIGGQDFYFHERRAGWLYLRKQLSPYSSRKPGLPMQTAIRSETFGTTTGTLTMRGNYYDVDNDIIGKTDLLFSSGDPYTNLTTVIMENNFLFPHGVAGLFGAGTRRMPHTQQHLRPGVRDLVCCNRVTEALCSSGVTMRTIRLTNATGTRTAALSKTNGLAARCTDS